MDRIAVERGIMASYQQLIAAGDGAPWNVVVIVGYPGAGGYREIAPQFEEIRAAHKPILVEGKGLAELGRIVETRRLAPFTPA
jgi:hypothetical protein